jgi:hypothetical protein
MMFFRSKGTCQQKLHPDARCEWQWLPCAQQVVHTAWTPHQSCLQTMQGISKVAASLGVSTNNKSAGDQLSIMPNK